MMKPKPSTAAYLGCCAFYESSNANTYPDASVTCDDRDKTTTQYITSIFDLAWDESQVD